MRFRKTISTVFLLSVFFVFIFSKLNAQIPKVNPKPQILVKDNKTELFKEGETVIAEVEFTGLDSSYQDYDNASEKAVYEGDFLKFLSENRATIFADEKFNSRKIEKVVRFLKKWLAEQGYLKAEVVALGIVLPQNQMKLIFSVNRDMVIGVSEIRFVGNKNFTNEEFVGVMKECLKDSWEKFDKRYYEYCANKDVRGFMFSKGYFKATVERLSPRFVNNSYIETIAIKEGIRYRIGEIKFEGATVSIEKEILEMLDFKTGDVADGKAFQNFVYEKLKRIYGDKGYVLFNAEFDPTFIEPKAEGLDATVNILITIDEGKAFRMTKLEFIGVEKEKARELRKIFSLKDGKTFNQSELEKGIKKINEMKEFYPIDVESDVDRQTDEENAQFSITINLTKIK